MKYELRVKIVAAIRALAKTELELLQKVFNETKDSARDAAVKKAFPKLYAHADGNVRQLRFHAFADPYAKAAGHAFAIDGGTKRGQMTLITSVDSEGHELAVIAAPDGSPEKVKVIHTFHGSDHLERAKAAYRAEREGQPYVPKTKGKFAVDLAGPHVNAAMVSVDSYERSRNKNAFQVYRAGTKG
jgi:hypothetical protein